MRKSLHIIDTLGPGGAQTVAKTFFEHQYYNDNIFLVALRKTDPLVGVAHKNVMVSASASASKYSFFPLLSLIKLISENNITALHCHLPRSQVFGLLLKLYFSGRIKLIFHEQGDILENRTLAFILRLFGYYADTFIACSRHVKNALVEIALIDPERINVIYNCVSADFFGSGKRDMAELQRLGIDEHDFVVGFAARLIERKGWKEFIDSAKLLHDKGKIKFIIAGTGPDEKEMRKYIQQVGLNEVIVCLGYVRDMVWFYSLLDVFVIPSHWEPMGIAQLEAQAMCVPVIAARVDGLNEVVDSSNTVFFETRNAKVLAEKIRILMPDSKEKAVLIAEGEKNAKKYSVNYFSEKLNLTLESIAFV